MGSRSHFRLGGDSGDRVTSFPASLGAAAAAALGETVLSPPYASAEYSASEHVRYVSTVRVDGARRMYAVPWGAGGAATTLEIAANVRPPPGAGGVSGVTLEVLLPTDAAPPAVTLGARYGTTDGAGAPAVAALGEVDATPAVGASEVRLGVDAGAAGAAGAARSGVVQVVVRVVAPAMAQPASETPAEYPALLVGRVAVAWTAE